MALIKEDGTIVADADTYASVTDLDDYATNYNLTLTASSTAEKEALLREAMDFLYRFVNRWKGARSAPDDQELAWPRTGVYVDGVLLPENEIPRALFYAQLKLAVTADSTDLLPVTGTDQKGPVIEETVHGAVTVRYANGGKVLPVPSDADALAQLRPLLRNNGLQVIRA